MTDADMPPRDEGGRLAVATSRGPQAQINYGACGARWMMPYSTNIPASVSFLTR